MKTIEISDKVVWLEVNKIPSHVHISDILRFHPNHRCIKREKVEQWINERKWVELIHVPRGVFDEVLITKLVLLKNINGEWREKALISAKQSTKLDKKLYKYIPERSFVKRTELESVLSGYTKVEKVEKDIKEDKIIIRKDGSEYVDDDELKRLKQMEVKRWKNVI